MNTVLNSWWNVNTSFTDCEQKMLGWTQSSDKLATFSSSNKYIVCENNNFSTDFRHANIECYNKEWRGTHICILKNIYGYITSSKDLKFKAFCKQKINKKTKDYMNRIKQQFRSKNTENTNYPLFLDLIDDTQNSNKLKMDNINYKVNNKDIWYYDNSHQCEWHKKNDVHHIGNPWHCFGHIEYWFGIAYKLNITLDTYNITVVQSQFTNNQFGAKEAIYHFYDVFFNNVVNKNTVNKLYSYNPSGELFYIKELIIDERIARDWGMSVIWQHQVKSAFNKRCPDNKNKRRSPIFYEMRKQMMNYYETHSKYTGYDWMTEIYENKWIVYGDLKDIIVGSKLVFIATRYVNNVCRYRCIANGLQLKDAFLDLFNSINDKFVLVYGNPGVLSFYAQYNLFKHTRIFIGVHGAVFLMASLFMPPWSLKFEITMPYNTGQHKQQTSQDIVAYFDDENEDSYAWYFCIKCVVKRGKHPSNIDTNAVIDSFINKFLCFIYDLCDKDDIVSYIQPEMDRLRTLHFGKMGKNVAVKSIANVSDVEYTFTECEQKYLGWKRDSYGDLSFEQKKKKVICENKDYENDLRHLNMDCWHVHDNKGKNYICLLKNVYGFVSDDNKIHFVGYCKHKLRAIANGIMQDIYSSFNGKDPELVKYPLYLDIISDEKESKKMKVDDIKYADNNSDIWYYDNCHQCESHKKNDKQHIGNPWHCFGHIEYYYHIAHRLGITINNYNTTVVMSQFSNDKFSQNTTPIYHFFTPFFKNIINKQVVVNEMQNNKNNFFYIKQMIIDHRIAKGWGYGTIWKSANVKAFDVDKSCKQKNLRRSQIMLEMKRDMIHFYESNSFYANYDWINEIRNMKGNNKWEINGNIGNLKEKKIIFIATRWMDGICRYRCIANGNELKNKFIQLFQNDNKYIILYGNPGSVSFRAQYHLFKNTDVFIGVHGAVFLMASLFMQSNTFKFEITMGENRNKVANSFGLVSMFDARQFYASYYCNACKYKGKQQPSKINVNQVSEKVMTAFYNISHLN